MDEPYPVKTEPSAISAKRFYSVHTTKHKYLVAAQTEIERYKNSDTAMLVTSVDSETERDKNNGTAMLVTSVEQSNSRATI
jgi:hypothetical protein